MVIATTQRDLRFPRSQMLSRGSGAAFAGVAAVLFTATTAITVQWCLSMAAMGEMPMPGGWTMSMAWMRMPGQIWATAAASFTAMWLLMMVTMMLPSLAPTLWRYREAIARTGCTRPDRLAALAAIGYFFVWTVIGMAVFFVGVSLAAVEMKQPALARAVPMVSGIVFLLAGVLQFSEGKTHRGRRRSPALAIPCGVRTRGGASYGCDLAAAWRYGLRLGLHCSFGCAGLTAILLVMGVMDLRAMVVVTSAITAERLAPNRDRVTRAIGTIAAGAGLYLIARAAAAV